MPLREQLEIVGVNKTKKALGEIQSDLGRIRSGFGSATKAAGAFVGALAIREVAQFGKMMLDTTATFEQYRNQLRLITKGQEDLDRVFGRLVVAAQENRTAFGDTVDLFTKLRVTTENLGVSEERVINVTGKLSKALQLAGADGNTASSVIRQFGQAMASGEVRGDEFRSLVEALGPALSIMARETGISVGQLRKMSQAGELTAETLFKMLENSTALEDMFAKTNPTLGQLEIATKDAFDRAVVAITEATGLSDLYRKSLLGVKNTLDRIAGIEDPFAVMNLTQLESVQGLEQQKQALDEVRDRYLKLLDTNIVDFLIDEEFRTMILNGTLGEQFQRLKEVEEQIKKNIKVTEEQVAQNEALKKALEEEQKATKAITDTVAQYTDEIERYKKLDFRSQVEKLTDQQNEAAQVIEKLLEAQAKLNTQTESGKLAYEDLANKVEIAKKAYEGYGEQLDEIAKKEQEAKAKAIKASADKLKAEIMRILEENQRKRDAALSDIQRIQDSVATEMELLQQQYNNRLAIIQDALDKEYIQKQRADELKQKLEAQHLAKMKELQDRAAEEQRRKELKAQGVLQKDIERSEELREATVAQRNKAVLDSTVQMFQALGQENKKAFQAYKALAVAQAIIDTIASAQSAFRAFSWFPPLAFAAAGAALAAGYARVNAIRAQTYGGRQEGGPVTGGSPFLIGEAGPEIFTPKTNGNIIPLDKMGTGKKVEVNFQITTLDASGFQDLLYRERSMIVNIINDAVMEQGREAVV